MRRFLLAACSPLLLAGCAQIGAVLPPSAGLPAPVGDLRAARVGPLVQLSWTAPRKTSDGMVLNTAVHYSLCAWPGVPHGTPAPARTMRNMVGGMGVSVPSVTQPQIPSPTPTAVGGNQTPDGALMPACPHLQPLSGASLSVASLGVPTAVDTATLAIYALNRRNQGAGWSNLARVALTPVAAAPKLLTATPTAGGVALRWLQPPAPPGTVNAVTEILRDQAVIATRSAPPGPASFVDTTAAWDAHYIYALRSAAGRGPTQVESADSNRMDVGTADVFAPPPPTGLQAIAGPAGVDLTWNTVPRTDVAGYNVYRQSAGGAWVKVNPARLPTPVFHDPQGVAGSVYVITAVNLDGHEGPRSAALAAGR